MAPAMRTEARQRAKGGASKRRLAPVPLQSALSPLYLKPVDELRAGAALRDWRNWWLDRARQADIRLDRARRKRPAALTTHEALRRLPIGPRDRIEDRVQHLVDGAAFK